jgi:hypothetical protein
LAVFFLAFWGVSRQQATGGYLIPGFWQLAPSEEIECGTYRQPLGFNHADDLFPQRDVVGTAPSLGCMLYGWTGQQSSSGFSDPAPSILHYNWFRGHIS